MERSAGILLPVFSLPGAYGIRNIPTLLFFKDGKLVDKHVGAAQKPALKEKVEALLK